jgi:hypothetical protein
MSYLPTIAWSTVINDVVMLTTTTYRVTISPLNPNEPGGDIADVAIGYFLKDFVGNVYDITGISVGGDPTRIEVTDPTDVPSGYGPQSGQVAFIYSSPQDGNSPYLAPVRNKRLDQSALDYSRSIEMDISWKHRGFRENTSNHDNVTTVALGDGFVYSVEHDTGWHGGNKLSLSCLKKSYTVFLSQTGTNAPTETVVLVNEIGNIVWTRVSAGIYRATLASAFVANHTAPLDDIMMDQSWNLYKLNWIDANVMELKTYAAADITALADSVLSSRYINFEVYL